MTNSPATEALTEEQARRLARLLKVGVLLVLALYAAFGYCLGRGYLIPAVVLGTICGLLVVYTVLRDLTK